MKNLGLIYDIAVIAFVVNMFVGLFWKLIADKTHNNSIIYAAFKGIIRSDYFVTIPSLIVVLFLNYCLNGNRPFLFFSLTMFSAVLIVMCYSVLLFIFFINPLRSSLTALVSDADEFDLVTYKKLSRKWIILGILELAPFIVVLLLSLN